MSKDKIKGSVCLMPQCKWCGSNQRFFAYTINIFYYRVRIYCKDCGYSTKWYPKEIDSFKEWVRDKEAWK